MSGNEPRASRTIYTYPFEIDDEVSIPMAKGAQILSVQLHRGVPTVCALVSEVEPLRNRVLQIRGTGRGEDAGDVFAASFLATLLMPSGLVFHVFDGGER